MLSAAGQIVLAENRNGGMLRLIASRHDDDDGDDKNSVFLGSNRSNASYCPPNLFFASPPQWLATRLDSTSQARGQQRFITSQV